jgi:putative DNA primase/helicase
MASYEELQKLSAWLKISEASVGRTVLMPMTTSDVKAPMFKHAGKAQWGWAEADAYANSNPTHTPWGMLLDGLVVVDADDAETVEWLEMMKYEEGEVGEAMQRCAIQETRKGRHYMFLRPQWADEEGYYDGARQVKHKEVDMKTLCRTGTRSLLSVAPTEGKAWVKGRAPWELESMMIPYIPKALMERVAKKIRTAGASKANVATKTEVDSESSRLQGQGTVVMIPNSFMESPPVEKLLLLLSKSRWDSRETWRGVATALKNEYGETYKVLWKKMSKVSSRYDEEAAEKLWETVGRPHYDGPKLTMKTVVKWACEDDPHGYAAYRAASIPKLIKDRWEKGDYGLGQIVHFLLQGTVKKTGGGHKDYYIFEEDTCRWAKVDDGFVNTVAMNVLEGVMRDIDLWISTQTAQLFCIGVGEEDDEEEDSMSKSGMDVKKKKVATLTNYVMSYRGVKNVMAIAGPLLMDETFEQRLDSNRHLIGIKGGSVVDLRTGKKRQRVAEDMVHNELDVAYDGGVMTAAAATNAEWMHRIVQKIMGGDEAMARFLQILLGYGITGEVREEVFPVWTGSGRNGKGLLTQALQQLLGAYYKEMNCAIISDSRVCSNIDAERAKLIGARLAVFNELKNGEKLKTNEVQLLTGGDGFPAKALYKDPVTVMPRHLVILITNYMPEMSDVITAMVERLLIIEFPVTFRDLIPGERETETLRQCDRTMKERLKAPEGQSALFAWLVEGAVAWYGGTEGLKAIAPKKVTEFTRQYLAEQDGVQAFLAENCEFAEDFRESSVALFHRYREESGENNDREKWFHRQMKSKGFMKKVLRIEGNSTRGYMGLRLRG